MFLIEIKTTYQKYIDEIKQSLSEEELKFNQMNVQVLVGQFFSFKPIRIIQSGQYETQVYCFVYPDITWQLLQKQGRIGALN